MRLVCRFEVAAIKRTLPWRKPWNSTLGQVQIVAGMVADGSILIKTTACKAGSLKNPEMDAIHNVTALCNEIRRELGFLPGESYGVGNRAVSDKAHRAYEMEKVVKKVLALHDNPNPTFRGVNYDGLSIRYTEDPAPVCVIEEGSIS